MPEGMVPGTPFSCDVVAPVIYPRFVHPVSDRRLSRLTHDLFGFPTRRRAGCRGPPWQTPA